MAVPGREERERWHQLEQLDEWLRTPMLLLSLVWLIIVLVELLKGSSQLLEIFGTAIWIIFIAEFLLRFALAPERLPFLRSNWLTILSLFVPAFRLLRGLRFLRAARALRGARLIRIVGTANRSMNALKATLRRRRFGYVLGLTALVVALGAAGMLSFEPAGEVADGFTSYGDALWWTGMLMTSIGSQYGRSRPKGGCSAFCCRSTVSPSSATSPPLSPASSSAATPSRRRARSLGRATWRR